MVRKWLGHLLWFLSIFLGEWTPPKWMQWIFSVFSKLGTKVGRSYKERKSLFVGGFVGVAILAGAGYGGYQWWLSRPQPVKLSIKANHIYATPLNKFGEPQKLIVTFGGSAAQLEQVGKEVSSGIMMSPSQDGKWKWTEDDELQFTIVGDWPVGQEIKVEFDKKLFPKHVHLEEYELAIRTEAFSARVTNVEFYQHPKRPEEKKVVSTFKFSHPVDPKSFESNLKLVLENIPSDRLRTVTKEKKSFKVTYNDFFGEAYVHSERLDIPRDKSQMVVTLDEGVVSSRGGEGTTEEVSDSVSVPSMFSYFKVDETSLLLVRNEDYEPEQVLAIETRDRVAEAELSKSLEVYLLPKDRQEKRRGKLEWRRNVSWYVNQVTKEVLAKSSKLELKQVPQPYDFNKQTSYRYEADPGRYLYIRVKKGLGSYGGYELAEDYVVAKKVPKFPKELSIMSKGSLLSLTGDKKISIVGRDLEYVRFSAHRVLPGQVAHLITQTGGDLMSPSFNNYNFDLDNLSTPIHKVVTMPVVGRGKSQYTHFDFQRAMSQSGRVPRGLFLFEATSWNKRNSYSESPKDRRLILITDLGVIAKKTVANTHNIFIQSIRTGRPVSGAKVSVLGKNGIPILSDFTGPEGRVEFPSLEDFRREKQPIAFTVERENDFSFLPLTYHVSELNYSKFDVGGVRSRYRSETLQSYLFSDRGIYRPGDEARIGFIVKDSDWSKSLSNTLIEMQVRNPKGNLVRKKRMKMTDFGIQEFQFKTFEDWPTGSYSISLYLVKKKDRLHRLDSIKVKVEEFLPDRMKITARFSVPPNKGWLKPDELKGNIVLQNLFGTPAQNRRVRGEISLSPSYPAFRAFKEYQFFDPLRSRRSYRENLEETQTDAEGNATFDLNLDKYESASYHLAFIAEGFEAEGGRSVIATSSTLISPLDYLVGYKAEGSLNYLAKASDMKVQLIAVDPNLKMLEVKDLKLRRIQYKPISALVKQGNGTYKYESVEKEVKLDEKAFTLSGKGHQLQLDTTEPGDYAYIVMNSKGMELNRVRYSVMGSGNLSFDLEKNAELQVKLNKADFNPGELIEINIRSPYTGSGLITIERDQVYAHKWFKTSQNSSVQTIRIPKNLEGNGYVNVTFTRSLNSEEIFMSPLSVGIAPFSINKSSRVNKIALRVPELIRPGTIADIGYKSEKPGRAILFVVDQGILSVAKYKKPDPLSHFYKKKALEVQTKQILDLLLPEFSMVEKRRSSAAGGAAGMIGKNLNPFKRKRDKPVALWSGVVRIGPAEQNWSVEIPDYFSGQVSVFAVAVGRKSMDAEMDSSLVKGHFVISPNTPMMMAPGDKARISAGISNNIADSGEDAKVDVSVRIPKGLKIVGAKNQELKISANSESSVVFEVEALDYLGNVNIHWKAKWKDKETKRKSTLSLRPISVYRTEIQTGVVTANQRSEAPTPRRTYKEFESHSVKVSKLPISIAFGLKKFLDKYPHGCTEQIVSKAFPAMVMSSHKDFKIPAKKLQEQYNNMVSELRSRELPSGGLSLWPGGGRVAWFHTAYAAHYLTEAKDRGFYGGVAFLKESLLPELREFAEMKTESLQMARAQALASYLLTRNEELATKALANLEEWFAGYKSENWVSDIALLYMASAYKLMKADTKAKTLIGKYKLGEKVTRDYGYGVYDRNIRELMTLYLASKHFPKRKELVREKEVIALAQNLGQSYNTRSSAMAMLAFLAYAESGGTKDLLSGVEVYERIGDKALKKLAIPAKLFASQKFSGKGKELELKNNPKGPLFYAVEQSGFSLKSSQKRTEKSIEVHREFTDLNDKPITQVKVGTEIKVHLKLRSTDNGSHYNVAVVDLLPGGFDPVLDSIDRDYSSADYVDVREDRLVIYLTANKKVRNYSYKIKATSRGQFQVPAIVAKSMYDLDVYSIGETGSIEVVK